MCLVLVSRMRDHGVAAIRHATLSILLLVIWCAVSLMLLIVARHRSVCHHAFAP